MSPGAGSKAEAAAENWQRLHDGLRRRLTVPSDLKGALEDDFAADVLRQARRLAERYRYQMKVASITQKLEGPPSGGAPP